MNPLFRVLLFISFFLLSSCAAGKQPKIPIVHNSTYQQIVNEEGRRILAVTKNADKAHLYTFHLARFKKPTGGGQSVGDHTIYISAKLMRGYIAGNPQYLRVILAHEIAHDVLEHQANQGAMVNVANAGIMIGNVMSRAPGIIGLIGSGLSLTASLGGRATLHLYSRSAELEADRAGIEYWKRLGWDCSFWVSVFQRNLERGAGDFHHPAAVRVKQAAELCLSPPELQYVLESLEAIEQRRIDQMVDEQDQSDESNNEG